LHVALRVGAIGVDEPSYEQRAEEVARAGRIDPLDKLARRPRVALLGRQGRQGDDAGDGSDWPTFYAQWLSPAAIRFVKLPGGGTRDDLGRRSRRPTPAAARSRRSSTAAVTSTPPAKCSLTCSARCSHRTRLAKR
jgi:hypothetical protein